MMKKRMLKYTVVLALLLSLFSPAGWAEDSEASRTTLAGLQGVSVVVEKLQPNLQKYAAKFDLNSQEIRRDVERKLREGGIRVVEGNDWLALPGRPVLSVSVNTHETEKYWYAYDIKLELRQLAVLEANPKVKTLAGTWSISVTGLANIGNLHTIRQDAAALAQRFVQAFKTANNKR